MDARRYKLTLSIDPGVLDRLKEIADKEGVSLSRLFEREMDRYAERYLAAEPARPLHVAEPRRELDK